MQTIYQHMPTIDKRFNRQRSAFPDIVDPFFWDAYERVKQYSFVQIPGFWNIYQSMSYLARNRVPGDLVECGVFLGGMSMFIAILREHFGLTDRKLYLYDTFCGFPEGSADSIKGNQMVGPAHPHFLNEVKEAFVSVVPSCESVDFIEGPVEETLRGFELPQVALARLDTDFYSSTLAELEAIYPRIVPQGVLVIDDYGLFDGARRATDEYCARLDPIPYLHRVDATVCAMIKPAAGQPQSTDPSIAG